MIVRLIVLFALAAFASSAPRAQDLSAVARVLPGGSIEDKRGEISLTLPLSQAVPYRVFQLTEPFRLVVDFREVDWSLGNTADLDQSEHVIDLRAGALNDGWSRLVLQLDGPWALKAASMTESDAGASVLAMALQVVSDDEFIALAGAPDDAAILPPGTQLAPKTARATRDLPLIVLDPGHGGIDPGAEFGGEVEARLMLKFALELKELLVRSGDFQVVLTRDADYFVPLEARIAIAHAVEADLFLSLHADALAEGRATGATIYTLADEASDFASEKLAERHDRDELLSGIDLTAHDDEIALALMSLARVETAHSSGILADALVAGLDGRVELYKHPHLHAGFSVLKSPDIPSALVELGFLSQADDRRNLTDPDWRAQAAEGILLGLREWVQRMDAEAGLRRR